jgi:hypothetical protein
LSTESEFVGKADRASAVVHDQITAMIDAARNAARDIERRARLADAELRRAEGETEAVIEKLRLLEGELALLLNQIAREADALEARRGSALERARPTVVMQPGPSDDAGLAAASGHVVPPLFDAVVEETPEPVSEAEPVPPSDAESETGAGRPHEAVTVAAATVEAPVEPAEPAEPATEAAPAESPGGELSEAARLRKEAQTRVAATNDLDLAELHQIAQSRASKGSEGDRHYWSTLLRATVEEAVSRRNFGQAVSNDDSGGRRETKRRLKLLKPLMSARQEAMRSSDQG